LAAAMKGLLSRQRVAIWLRYGQDLTCVEVGKVLGVRESAAKQLVARARANLREGLTAEGKTQS
jgi:RNA polymerase sigma factor (sigma-70 family)